MRSVLSVLGSFWSAFCSSLYTAYPPQPGMYILSTGRRIQPQLMALPQRSQHCVYNLAFGTVGVCARSCSKPRVNSSTRYSSRRGTSAPPHSYRSSPPGTPPCTRSRVPTAAQRCMRAQSATICITLGEHTATAARISRGWQSGPPMSVLRRRLKHTDIRAARRAQMQTGTTTHHH